MKALSRKKKRHQRLPHAVASPAKPMSSSAKLTWRQQLAGWLFPPLAKNLETEGNWRYLWPLLGGALVLRITVALSGDFVLHPDEIMQYLEPAHQTVFGNGVLYWEYVYGARNWLIPGAVSMLLWLFELLGLGHPAIYVNAVKIAFCLLSMLIPWGMYRSSQHLFGERSARLALLGGCFWYELIGFAHKPMQEFVATAVFMLALALVCGLVRHGRAAPAAVAGCVCILVGALRMQYAPLALLLLIVLALLLKPRMVLAMLAGAALSAMLIIGIEWFTWGAALHSYLLNMLVNLELDTLRRNESLALELPLRLIAASLGGVLLALLGIVFNPRRALLLTLLIALLLLLHSQFSHREYRFIYLCIPLWLMLAAHALIALENTLRTSHAVLIRKAFGVLALILGIAALFNQLPFQPWIHKAYSKESNMVNYLQHQDPLFDAFAYLARQNDVSSVLVLPTVYFNTPGYYYLHHDIPFYDQNEIQRIISDSETGTISKNVLTKYISHIVIEEKALSNMKLLLYSPIAKFNQWHIMRRKDNRAPVAKLTQHVMHPDYGVAFGAIVQRIKNQALYKALAKQHLINPAVGNAIRLPKVKEPT